MGKERARGGSRQGRTAAVTRPGTRARRRTQGGGAKRWVLRVGLLSLVLGLFATAAVIATLGYYSRGLPTVATLRRYNPP